MKNIGKILMLVALTTFFTSCESIKSVFDVEVETTLSGDLDIDVEEPAVKSAGDTYFEANTVIDPMTDEQVEKYADNIKQIRADNIAATVIDSNLDGVIFREGMTITMGNGDKSVTWRTGNEYAIVPGLEFILPDTGGLYNAVSDILTAKEMITVSCTGYCNKTGVKVKLRTFIETTVIANPL